MIYIYTGPISENNNNEWYYCKEVCKVADDTLTDNDFTRITSVNTPQAAIDLVAKSGSNKKDILIIPFINIDTYKNHFFQKYPKVNLAMPLATSPGGSFPQALALDPNVIPAVITVGGGVNGICDWFTGPSLEFVQRSLLFGAIDETQQITDHVAVENITNLGGGLMKIQTLGAYSMSTGFKFRISGVVSSFQNDPNGTYNVVERHVWDGSGGYSPTENWITVNFDPGTGSYTSAGVIDCEFLSGAVSHAAALIHKIARERDTTIQIARRIARLTGSEDGVHSDSTGYGEIDVDAAINYSGSIPDDSYNILGSAGDLTATADDKGGVDFVHPEIVNAKEIWIYRGSKVIAKKQMNPGQALLHHIDSAKLYSQTYTVKGKRDESFTQASTPDSTNIESATGYPKPTKLSESNPGYWIELNELKSGGPITSVIHKVRNVAFESIPTQSNKYKFGNGLAKDADKVAISPRILFAQLYTKHLGTLAYLNNVLFYSLDPFTTGSNSDYSGFDYTYCDFTFGGDCNFVGAIVAYANFTNAILPAAVSELDDFIHYVVDFGGYIDPDTVIWTDGELIGDRMTS